MTALTHIDWPRLSGLIPVISFHWPNLLWLLLLVPLLVAAYIYLLMRRRSSAIRYRQPGPDQAGVGLAQAGGGMSRLR